MPRYEQPGIYLETTGALESIAGKNGIGGYKHAYLIYRKSNGETEVLRGGFDAGKLGVETGKPLNESKDSNPDLEYRPSKRLPTHDMHLEETWQKMKARAEEIGNRPIRYDSYFPGDSIPEQNSNSVVRAALDAVGIDAGASLPDGVGFDDLPGFENGLASPEYFDEHDTGEPAASKSKLNSDDAPGMAVVRNAASDSALEFARSSGGIDAAGTVPEAARAKAMDIVIGGEEAAEVENDLDDLMLKSVEDLTEAEAGTLGQWAWKLPFNDPRRSAVEDRRQDFYGFNYGDSPANIDETGRLIEPKPVREIPAKSKGVAAPNGEPVSDVLKRIAGKLARPIDADGEVNVVKALQSGLALLGEPLTVDGVSGPKTKAALKRTIAKNGAGRAEEAFAMGRFKRFAEIERKAGGSASGLKNTIEKDVQPLFGARHPQVAAETLQESINDLNVTAAQEHRKSAPELLKVDGDIGPKTTDAVRIALAENGPERLAKSYTSMLGFGI